VNFVKLGDVYTRGLGPWPREQGSWYPTFWMRPWENPMGHGSRASVHSVKPDNLGQKNGPCAFKNYIYIYWKNVVALIFYSSLYLFFFTLPF
jgi:hypothetical protein